jgi:hemoglobin
MQLQRIRTGIACLTCALVLTGFGMAFSGTASAATKSLYTRLGGYDAITAVTKDVFKRLAADKKLGRFWAHRGDDGLKREFQLLVDFIVSSAGGPVNYPGREMKPLHVGMQIDEKDWSLMMGHLKDSLAKFKVPSRETNDVVGFFESTKKDIVEVK